MDEQNLTQKKRIEIESDYRDIETHGYRMDYDLKLEKDTDKIDKNQESFYTVSSAEEYNKKIKSVLEAMPESLPLGMRQKLTAKKNRNDAFILQNDRTWLGLGKDSPQMTAVKRQSKSLEFFLQEPFLTTNDLLNAENQIIGYYNDAIQACADYISSKRRRPLWPPYAARYDKVRALKSCYENELELLKNNLILLRSKDNDDFTKLRIFSPLDILTMNRFDADNIRVEKEFLRGHKQRPESEEEIAAKVESLKTASEQRKRVSGRDPITFKLNSRAGRKIHEQY